MKTIKDLQMKEDKLSIFQDFEKLKQYIVTVKDLIDAVSLCLNDAQKLEVIKLDYFQRLKSHVRASVIMTINDDAIKSQIIQDLPFLETAFDQYNFTAFLKTVNDESKMYVLNSPATLKKINVSTNEIRKIIETMSSKKRTEILSDREFTGQLELENYDLIQLIKGLENDEEKLSLAKEYELSQYDTVGIIKSCSDEKKKSILLEDKDEYPDRYIVDILSSFEAESIIEFINNQQKFFENKQIKPFQFIKQMPNEKQIKLVEKIDEIDLPEGEKRRIFAALSNEVKKEIDLEKIDEKYRKLIGIELSEEFHTFGQIIPELNGDLSQYQDIDKLLSINPLHMVKSEEDRQQLIKLCQICPNAKITDNLAVGSSIGEEYIKGEQWVSSVLQGIQPEWTDVQKLAYIDTMIGKKISYTPEFGTEAEMSGDARALWKIIATGYGVCNGIAQIEQYLLSRVGIEAELVSSKTHSFVKVKNIKIPTENGIVEGDTLVDPTWNLTASRYGGRPQHFCKSYEELRKVDIDANGIDHACHRNEELEQSKTIDMDIPTLRKVYNSIGIAEKDGNFPLGKLIEQVEQIDNQSIDMQSKINSKFAALKKWCPEFATCQNSTIDILKDVLFEANEKFDFERCVVSRVYDKEDAKKQAVLYVYMQTETGGKQFFYASKEEDEFVQLSQEEFERKFECYEADIQKLPDHKRPWETNETIEEKKENSSGKVVAEEGR